MSRLEINSYFMKKGIEIVDEDFKGNLKTTYDDIIRQVDIITLFHLKVGEYRENLMPRIGCTIGKDIESYKLQLRRLNMDMELIRNKTKEEISSVELYMLCNGVKLIKHAEGIISDIIQSDYEKLIKRAMNNYEVCLYKVDERNLVLGENNKIRVGTIKYLTYNLVEHDLYSYIKRIKKKCIVEDSEVLVERFVNNLSLDDRSIVYLNLLLSIPTNTLKVWNSFKNSKKYIDETDCLEALTLAMNKDGIE